MASTIDRDWLRNQVQQFAKIRPKYEQYEEVLRTILQRLVRDVCPAAIVQARAKNLASFAGKCVRRFPELRDPVHELTDLCGARVILQLPSDVDAMSDLVRKLFDVDEANSQDTKQRLGHHEFGYRSVHFIVSIDSSKESLKGLVAPADLRSIKGLKAEIQLRTMAQHAWADIGHDRLYKSAFQVPADYERQSAKIAAMLEEVDAAFTQLVQGVDVLRTNVGAYRSERQTRAEIDRLSATLEFDPNNAELARDLALRQISIGELDGAMQTVRSFTGQRTLDLDVCWGQAQCQKHQAKRQTKEYRQGRKILEDVVSRHPGHLEALTLLAESWIGEDNAVALAKFRQAFEADPTDPRALAGYLRHQIAEVGNLHVVPLLRPAIEAAIRKSQDQIAVRVNLPFALYHQAEFFILLNQPYEGMYALTRAIALTVDLAVIERALLAFESLTSVEDQLIGAAWARRVLRLARQVRRQDDSFDPELMPTAGVSMLQVPVVIVAGGCDPAHAERLAGYRDLLFHAFQDWSGTIVSGGTQEGISGLVGDLLEASHGRIQGLGYLPASLPKNGSATIDKRFRTVSTDGNDSFSAAEPIQNWIDLLRAGIQPKDVRLLGINGGRIAAFEYHLAAALGAQVAVIRLSGREADKLLLVEDQPGNERIMFLPRDKESCFAFIHKRSEAAFSRREINDLAQMIHESYIHKSEADALQRAEQERANNDELRAAFDRSNSEQADHIRMKLARLGKQAVPLTDRRKATLTKIDGKDLDTLAEMEHGRWVVERIGNGWRLGPREDAQRRRPSLVAWNDLSAEDKEKDYDVVRLIPELLQQIGYKIVDLDPPPPTAKKPRARR